MAAKTGIPKPPSPVAKNYANPVELNSRVLLSDKRYGIVRYVGRLQSQEGEWYGIELDTPEGDNDGAISSDRYFQCNPKHGLFVQRKQISTLREIQRIRSMFVKSPDQTSSPSPPSISPSSESGSKPRKKSLLKAFHQQFALKFVPPVALHSNDNVSPGKWSPTCVEGDAISVVVRHAEPLLKIDTDAITWSTTSSGPSSASSTSSQNAQTCGIDKQLRLRSLDGATMKLFAQHARQPSEVFQSFAASHHFLRDNKSNDGCHNVSHSDLPTASATTTTTDSNVAMFKPNVPNVPADPAASGSSIGDAAALARVQELQGEMTLLKTNHENVVAVLRDANRRHARNVLELRAQVTLLLENKQELENKLLEKDQQQSVADGGKKLLVIHQTQQELHAQLGAVNCDMTCCNRRHEAEVEMLRDECQRLRHELSMLRELMLM